jgi:hypothetical protein
MTILKSVDIKRISSDQNPHESIWPGNDDFIKNQRQSWFFFSDF